MSLKGFHFVFILASILLSGFFSLWCFGEYSAHDGIVELSMGIFSTLSFLGLTYYLVWFLKKYRSFGFFILIPLLWANQSALGCAVCMGGPNSPYVKSASAGVWFLLAVVGTVLAGFASVFLVWARRARSIR